MNKSERKQKKIQELSEIKCCFELANEQKYIKLDDPKIARLKKAMYESGIILNLDEKKGLLTIDVIESKFVRKNYRNAGRKEKSTQKKSTFMPYMYSDIVCMMETMTDKEIMTKINLSYATYYRRKKEMLTSDYFSSLDRNKLGDIKYLNSVEGNKIF